MIEIFAERNWPAKPEADIGLAIFIIIIVTVAVCMIYKNNKG